MVAFPDFHDIAARVDGVFMGYGTAIAAGTGDNTEVAGGWIDRRGHDSIAVLLAYQAVLAQTKTLSLAANLQDADDSSGTNPADYGGALTNAVKATGPTGGATMTGVVKLGFDLADARRYIRIQFTPDLSNTATDTAAVAAVGVWGPGVVRQTTKSN